MLHVNASLLPNQIGGYLQRYPFIVKTCIKVNRFWRQMQKNAKLRAGDFD